MADRGCLCKVCRRFRLDDGWTFNVLQKGFCDICKRTDAYIVKWVPDLLKKFLSIQQVCWACRNGISAYVSANWGLCWADDSDESLKWALCDWMRSHNFNNHFWLYQFIERECCKDNHGRRAV